MSRTISRLLIILGAVLLLGSVNYSVYKKEAIKQNGEVVFLELLPVDPRSLMQGDYMALRFALAAELDAQLYKRLEHAAGQSEPAHWIDGKFETVHLVLDSRGVAALAQSEAGPRLRYRIRDGQTWIGTNAFFFEEGTAERYTAAKYGEFRLDRVSGEAVLVGLRDAELKSL
jgi:uncharacterized membrane-anchored protein